MGRPQLSQGLVVVGGACQHQQAALAALGMGGLGPALQGFQAIAPVPTAAQQPHHHQPGVLHRAGDVVVDHSWMGQRRQVQGSQFTPEQLRLSRQQAIDRHQVGVGTAEEEQRGRRLLHEGTGIRLRSASR